ncbi:hypothetical protein Tco_1408637 [Tanacetum coccineum]
MDEVDTPLLEELGEMGEPQGAEVDEPMVAPAIGRLLSRWSKQRSRRLLQGGGASFPLLAPGLLVPPSMIEDLSTRLGNLEYEHGQLVKKVIQVSDAEVATGVTVWEIGPRVFAIEGQVQVMASQMVHAADRWEQAAVQQKDSQIQQMQTTFTEMGSQESTLMQCILGMDRRLTELLCMHIMYLGLVAVDGSDGTERGYQGLYVVLEAPQLLT